MCSCCSGIAYSGFFCRLSGPVSPQCWCWQLPPQRCDACGAAGAEPAGRGGGCPRCTATPSPGTERGIDCRQMDKSVPHCAVQHPSLSLSVLLQEPQVSACDHCWQPPQPAPPVSLCSHCFPERAMAPRALRQASATTTFSDPCGGICCLSLLVEGDGLAAAPHHQKLASQCPLRLSLEQRELGGKQNSAVLAQRAQPGCLLSADLLQQLALWPHEAPVLRFFASLAGMLAYQCMVILS